MSGNSLGLSVFGHKQLKMLNRKKVWHGFRPSPIRTK